MLCVIHENFRFQPWYREARRLIDAGVLGHTAQRSRSGCVRATARGRARTSTASRTSSDAAAAHRRNGDPLDRHVPLPAGRRGGDHRATAPRQSGDRRRGRRLPGVRVRRRRHRLVRRQSAATTTSPPNPRRTMGEMWLEGSRGCAAPRRRRAAVVEAASRRRTRARATTAARPTFGGGCCAALQRHVVAHLAARRRHSRTRHATISSICACRRPRTNPHATGAASSFPVTTRRATMQSLSTRESMRPRTAVHISQGGIMKRRKILSTIRRCARRRRALDWRRRRADRPQVQPHRPARRRAPEGRRAVRAEGRAVHAGALQGAGLSGRPTRERSEGRRTAAARRHRLHGDRHRHLRDAHPDAEPDRAAVHRRELPAGLEALRRLEVDAGAVRQGTGKGIPLPVARSKRAFAR